MNGLAARSVLPWATCRIDLDRILPAWAWMVAIFLLAATSARCFDDISVAPPIEADSIVSVGIWAWAEAARQTAAPNTIKLLMGVSSTSFRFL